MNTKKENYLSFEKAKDFIHKLKLKNNRDWRKYDKKLLPINIPKTPKFVYEKKGIWTNWGDFLGTNNIAHKSKNFLSYEDAKNFVHNLKIKNTQMWKDYANGKRQEIGKKPQNIPSNPQLYYKDKGWISYKDWLNTNFFSYEKAKQYITKLNIKTYKEWNDYDKKHFPCNMPKAPEMVYKKREKWISWGDFLGTNNIAPKDKKFLPYKDAIKFVHKLKLKNQKEWFLYTKGRLEGYNVKPMNIPISPNVVYKNKGWNIWKEWLGYN